MQDTICGYALRLPCSVVTIPQSAIIAGSIRFGPTACVVVSAMRESGIQEQGKGMMSRMSCRYVDTADVSDGLFILNLATPFHTCTISA